MDVNAGQYGYARRELVQRAEAEIESLSPAEVDRRIGNDGVVLIDLRDIRELKREGKIPGAEHVPRGMLEFAADPESPVYNSMLKPDGRVILYCGSGGRSALGAKTLLDMGYADVASLAGGYAAWKIANGTG